MHTAEMVVDVSGVNKAILIGCLGKDPELKQTPNGNAVATFSLATSEKFTDKAGAKHENTEWHNIVCWNKVAELAGKYLNKGSKVYVEGKITTRSWDDRDGKKCYRTEVIAQQLQFLSEKKPQEAAAASNDYGYPPPAYNQDDLPF